MNFEITMVKGGSGSSVILVELDSIFPTCKALTKDTKLPRLSCWTAPNSCFKGSYLTCMSELISSCFALFTGLPKTEYVICYWSAPQQGILGNTRVWGFIIHKDDKREPKISILNKWALANLKAKIGTKFMVEF